MWLWFFDMLNYTGDYASNGIQHIFDLFDIHDWNRDLHDMNWMPRRRILDQVLHEKSLIFLWEPLYSGAKIKGRRNLKDYLVVFFYIYVWGCSFDKTPYKTT